MYQPALATAAWWSFADANATALGVAVLALVVAAVGFVIARARSRR